MAKGSNNLSGRRSSSHNTKPYDANNSFVKKVATKVTDLIPQRSWISKWFNSSQSEGNMLDDNENPEEVESEEDIQKPPPLKRPCIRMDVTYPPGTFSIKPRTKAAVIKAGSFKQQYSLHNEMSEDFSKPAMAGPSGMSHIVSSTPTLQPNSGNTTSQRSELNLLVTTTNNGTTNGMDDNSESSESTSGCSSLIPQTNRQEAPSICFSKRKRFNDDKLSFTNHMQSPRSLLLDNHTRESFGSRRPSFNALILTNTPDRASLLASPFYSGNITFGGANAAGLYKRGRNLFNTSNEIQLNVPKRTSVEVKPSNTAGVDSSGMSQTAKKILEALEHFSSPITDAKKIPLKLMNNTSANKKRARDETTMSTTKVGLRHLTRELTVPTVPDILKLRRRQKLQDTTAAARKIISARSEPPPPQEYQIRTQTDDDVKHQGKVKTKTSNLDQEKTVEPVNLPNIPLPISSLPNFNFMPSSNLKAADNTNTVKEENFTFASPIKVTTITKNLKSINNFTFSSPINADKQATNKQAADKFKDSEFFSDYVPPVTQNFIWFGSSTAPRPKEKTSSTDNFATKPTIIELDKPSGVKAQLNSQKESVNDKAGTVVPDIKQDDNVTKSTNLKSNVQDTSNMWECPECLFKMNNSETQCFACKTAKPNLKNKKTSESSVAENISESKTTVNDNFGSQFKLSSNQWECTTCLVRNKVTDTKCIVCSALKPDTKQETDSNAINSANSDLNSVKPLQKSSEFSNTCSLITSKSNSLKTNSQKNVDVTDNTSTNQITSMSVNTSLNNVNPVKDEAMDKFKLSKDTWECPCCMVRNVTSVDSCPCCNTAKPSTGVTTTKNPPLLLANGFGDKFKKPEGSWNCDTCMVQNEAKASECVACGGLKPGAKKLESSSTSTGSSLQFNFCMPANTGGFKFGIDKADQEKTENTASTKGFKFGDSQQNNEAGQFVFGIQKEEKKTPSEIPKPENSVTSATGSGFGFQINTNNSEKTDVKQDSEKVEKKPALAFSFGIPKSESGTAEADKQPINVTSSTTLPSFTFGVPKPKIVQSDTKEEKQDSLPTNIVPEISKPNLQTTESTTTNNISVLPSITQSSSQESKQNTFAFGVLSNPISIATSTSTNVISSLPSSTQSSFMFLKPKSTAQTAPTLPTFGQVPATISNLPNTFKFEENKTAEGSAMPKTFDTLISNANSPSRMPLFSGVVDAPLLFSSNTDTKVALPFKQTTTEENKQPVFGTGTSKPATFALPENKVLTFGATENKPSIFGSPDTKIPVFGSTDNKTTSLFNSTPQAPTPFGAASATPTLFGTSAAPVFGNNATSTFTTESTPIIFGSTSKPNETSTQSSNLFTFGTTTQPVAQPGTAFNFSATTNPAESTPKPLFTFGSNSTTPQTGSLFGNTFNNPTTSNPSGFTFNAPEPETPAFGQPAAATPIFGASQTDTQNQPSSSFSSTPSNTGFNFGSTAPATSSGGFNFSAVASASTPSTGFNFNPLDNTTPTFDPNTPPSYNFTGGNAPKTFTGSQSVQRKVKRAFRRIR